MKKVITYGTYDLLHYGHIRLLERAKALGDYLIVGVTADDFDKTRGKINVQQSLMERIEAVRATGLADEIIVEEYEGQKIDDIRRLGVDIFTVGSDWVGKFDYLKEYCEVVYLPRTEGVSSSEIRAEDRNLRIGIVGEYLIVAKFAAECQFVNGVTVVGLYTSTPSLICNELKQYQLFDSYEELLNSVDAVYLGSHPRYHYQQAKKAFEMGKHVICESPIAMTKAECEELFKLAQGKGLVLFDALKTAYSTAYYRLLLLIKSGAIGEVMSVDATCTSLRKVDFSNDDEKKIAWNSISMWGPTALLPVFQILGDNPNKKIIVSHLIDDDIHYDDFTKVDLIYGNAVSSIKVGTGVKSEGEMVISGTTGYIYVPAPWWKTDYFEIRYENPEHNKKFFYQLEGEGIRYMIVAFSKTIRSGKSLSYVNKPISAAIAQIMEEFENEKFIRI